LPTVSPRIRNIASWRVKETDPAIARWRPNAQGADGGGGADFHPHHPAEKLIPNAVIDTYDDHRMACALSLASLAACRCASTIRRA